MQPEQLPEITRDAEDNRIKFAIAESVMPSERDQQALANFMLGVLCNYVPEEVWSYCIGQAMKCWTEVNGSKEQLQFTRERLVN